MEIDSNRLPDGPLPRRLADRYMSIVRRHAYRLARRLPSHVNVEDLMGAGFVGLADALKSTTDSGPDRFEAYADCRIRGAMLDELRSYDPLSRDLRDLNNRIVAAVRELTAELGRPPEEIEIARKLELPVAAFRERLAKLSFGGLVSLDTTGGDGIEGLELGDDGTKAADDQLLRTERRERLVRSGGSAARAAAVASRALLRAGLHAARDWRHARGDRVARLPTARRSDRSPARRGDGERGREGRSGDERSPPSHHRRGPHPKVEPAQNRLEKPSLSSAVEGGQNQPRKSRPPPMVVGFAMRTKPARMQFRVARRGPSAPPAKFARP